MKRQTTSLNKKYSKQEEMKSSNSKKIVGFKSKDEGQFMKNSPGRKQLGSDFKEIKEEICNIKGEIDQYFGEKMTNSCKKVEKDIRPGSPISLIHGSSPQLEVSIVSDGFSSSISSNDENLYKIKYQLISEELESMKRKYYLRKIEHKQLITKLCKKISSLEKMSKNKDYDLQQYKRILGREVTSIKQQIKNCIQNQMTSTIIQTSREQQDYNHKMQFSQILNPEYQTTNQVSKLNSLLNQKDLILSRSQDQLQKLKFQNLELQNLLQSKQKSQLLLQQTFYKQYQLTLINLKEQLNNQRLNSQDYRLRFQDLSKIRQLQYQQTQDQQNYLRLELQQSLSRESDCQNRFREIDRQRRQLNNKDMDVLRNQLAKKNSELVNMKAELNVKNEEINFLNKKLLDNIDFSSQLKNIDDKDGEIKQKQLNKNFLSLVPTLKSIEINKLQQQNVQLHQALAKTDSTISELKSSYQQQLYSLQIQYRRKNMEYEDKLKQFMKMIGAEVSDLMLRQQDYQLIEKQQQLQRANLLLSESQLIVCILEGKLKTLEHKNFINQIEPKHIHQISLLQFQNNYLKVSILSLYKKIQILSTANQKKDQIILNKFELNQSLLPFLKNLIVNIPSNFAQKFNDQMEIIKKLKEQNHKLQLVNKESQ